VQRKINDTGLILIRSFEGCKLTAYPDPGSPLALELAKTPNARKNGWENLPGNPWTVGWGSTGLDQFNLDDSGRPKPIGPNTTWTQDQADQHQIEQLQIFCDVVSKLVKYPISDNQFAALVSFAYNCGPNNLKTSSLLLKINNGDIVDAADEFLRWTRSGGRVLPGLVRRREAERRLFLSQG
jgi:lysozyme